jgi:DNA methylase
MRVFRVPYRGKFIDVVQHDNGSFERPSTYCGSQGTALKPAHEPIAMARKPLIGTYAKNLEAWGTGALNIDACRVRVRSGEDVDAAQSPLGRWPANVIHDGSDEVLTAFPEARGQQAASLEEDTKSAARFFYAAKASKADREDGCDDLPLKSGGELTGRVDGSDGLDSPRAGAGRGGGRRNTHPTVKPTALMRYLVRLVTPPGGVVLDPFMGSGSTGRACALEGFDFVGMELSPEYTQIAAARIQASLDLAEKEREAA